ncbi:MAG TPA: NAD(P)H-binding protein [Ktedonobacterales bacterium]|jgi:NADH dehydrogenase|nr:NAD(P)H-binding protein [Ktedonobacterales bacterium]
MILVTGAAGFAGSHIIHRLVEQGAQPRALVRSASQAATRLPRQGVEVVVGDTTRPETLGAAVAGVETIIHCAFITADRKQGPRINYEQTNVNGTHNLLSAARKAGVKRIVELGGLGTQPAPAGTYMATRYHADQEIKGSGLAWSILGPSVQFGKGAAFFKGLADLIRSTPLITPVIGTGNLRFQPIWVEDVTTCLLKMAQEPENYDGNVIEVGGPEIYTYNEILDMLMRALGKQRIKLPSPKPLAALGAKLMTAALPKPPITPATLELFDFENTTALDSVPFHFGFQPISWRDYLQEHGAD